MSKHCKNLASFAIFGSNLFLLIRLFGGESFDRILDIGTGNCYSAFVYGEEYPDAEVYGIELAAPYVR